MHTTNTNLSTPPTLPKALTPPLSQRARGLTGFTLVELIVVITILVILGTIAFLNLWGFSGSARDSARISNLANLQKGLNVYQVRTWTYPMPESSVAITASWTPIGYQWFAKDIVWGIAKISKWWTVDPSDTSIYTTYAVNQTLTKMQAMVFLEDSGNVTAYEEIPPTPLTKGGIIAFFNPLIKGVTSEASWGIPGIDTTYASLTTDYSKRFPKTTGDTLGILLSTATGTLNQPVQESGTGVDIISATGSYTMYFDRDTKVTGTGIVLKSGIVSTKGLVGYWDMETLSGALLKDMSGNANDGGVSTGLNIWTINHKGWASSFNWLNDHIEIPNTQNLIYNGDWDMTIGLWVYVNATETSWWVISKPWNWNGEYNYRIYFNNEWNWMRVRFTNSKVIWGMENLDGSLIKSNEWTYIVVQIKNNGEKKIFINGSLDIAGSWSIGKIAPVTFAGDANLPLSIWTVFPYWLVWWGITTHAFDGLIDEVRIYNRALSDSEIQTLYNSTK